MDNMLYNYKNGNAEVSIYEDGSRVVEFDGDGLELDYPLNIDIRISNKCSLGYNPKTGRSFCDYCHESARTDGGFCDFYILKEKLEGLPKGIELAIGSNSINEDFIDFLRWCKEQDYICNLTINQMHLKRDLNTLEALINEKLIKGIGISLRDVYALKTAPKSILQYPHSILHVIAGLDDLDKVEEVLTEGTINKILILGYKIFGEGVNYYNSNKDTVDRELYYWKTNFIRLVKKNVVLCFDTLAVQQLEVKRWLSDDSWRKFNQEEHSMYINAVDGKFLESSRSLKGVNWDSTDLKTYFKTIK